MNNETRNQIRELYNDNSTIGIMRRRIIEARLNSRKNITYSFDRFNLEHIKDSGELV